MTSSEQSPYLDDKNRLADVIAAIQAMASYKYYKLDFEAWADRIVGDKSQADHWKRVFEQHPEFFRLDAARARASLVWRRQRQKRFDVDAESPITKDQYDALDDRGRTRVSRSPLGAVEIGTLVETAISLHSRALEHKKESRWWVSVVLAIVAAVAGLVGTIVGAVISAQ